MKEREQRASQLLKEAKSQLVDMKESRDTVAIKLEVCIVTSIITVLSLFIMLFNNNYFRALNEVVIFLHRKYQKQSVL